MQVELLNPLTIGREGFDVGAVIETTDYSGQKLIDRGLAKKASKPKSKKKKKAGDTADD